MARRAFHSWPSIVNKARPKEEGRAAKFSAKVEGNEGNGWCTYELLDFRPNFNSSLITLAVIDQFTAQFDVRDDDTRGGEEEILVDWAILLSPFVLSLSDEITVFELTQVTPNGYGLRARDMGQVRVDGQGILKDQDNAKIRKTFVAIIVGHNQYSHVVK